jgi:hypothetical protein
MWEYDNGMDAKPSPEYERFTKLVDRVLSVPKTEIEKREQEYKATPKPKRGPKPKN